MSRQPSQDRSGLLVDLSQEVNDPANQAGRVLVFILVVQLWNSDHMSTMRFSEFALFTWIGRQKRTPICFLLGWPGAGPTRKEHC